MVLWPQIVLAPPIAMMTEIMRFFVDVVITLSLRSCEGRTSFVICNRKLGVAWACVSNLRIEERIESPRERLNKISDGPGRNCMSHPVCYQDSPARKILLLAFDVKNAGAVSETQPPGGGLML